jgi:hypothetical protein
MRQLQFQASPKVSIANARGLLMRTRREHILLRKSSASWRGASSPLLTRIGTLMERPPLAAPLKICPMKNDRAAADMDQRHPASAS